MTVYREQVARIDELRDLYGGDFPAVTGLALAALGSVQALFDDEPSVAATIAKRWEREFAIAEAWASHRSDVREIERKLPDGDVDHAMHVVDEYWRHDPIEMLRKCRMSKAREAMCQQYPDRHDAYRQMWRRLARGEMDPNQVDVELARLDALWLRDDDLGD